MTEPIAGRGDLTRTLELMWGLTPRRRRGPRARVDVRDLVAAAIALADAEGIAAVSTRRVAEAVGISPMSFYTHIPDKAVLLDLMLDAVSGDEAGCVPQDFDKGRWREDVRSLAVAHRDFLLRHPWVLQVTTHRPGVGPNAIRSYDRMLAVFDGLGLDEVEMDLSVTLITDYVRGAVRNVARARLVEAETGMSDEAWWLSVAPVLQKVDFSAFPVANRVGPVVGELYGLGDPDRAFEFGLERILDGFEALVSSATRNRSDGPARAS